MPSLVQSPVNAEKSTSSSPSVSARISVRKLASISSESWEAPSLTSAMTKSGSPTAVADMGRALTKQIHMSAVRRAGFTVLKLLGGFAGGEILLRLMEEAPV